MKFFHYLTLILFLSTLSVSYASNKSLWWNMSYEDALQDIIAITKMENLPESRSRFSNEIIYLESVTFDEKEKMQKYVLRMKKKQTPEELFEFYKSVSKDFAIIDCDNNNFMHPEVGKIYEFKDADGNVVGRSTTNYKNCAFEKSLIKQR